jgi:hypothetical protein
MYMDSKEVTGRQTRRREKKRRPRVRWMDNAELDLRNTGVERWRTRALDRREQTSVVRETKAKLKGP